MENAKSETTSYTVEKKFLARISVTELVSRMLKYHIQNESILKTHIQNESIKKGAAP